MDLDIHKVAMALPFVLVQYLLVFVDFLVHLVQVQLDLLAYVLDFCLLARFIHITSYSYEEFCETDQEE